MLSNGLNDAERVGWGSSSSQEKRFQVLVEIGNLENNSILDIGCGLGSLFEFIKKKYGILSYTGVDINPKMIELAKQNFSEAEFIEIDIIKNRDFINKRKFDYVFLSGALNLSEDKHYKNIKSMMKEMFFLSKKGVALNFLSMFSDHLFPGEYYCNPKDILDIAFSMTKKVILRHDYMQHDFTIYLYK